MQHNPVNELMLQGLRDCVYPGAVLLVGQDDHRLFFKGYGDANLFSGQPMTRETVFDLASLTKPLATTLAAAMLADRGVVDLDRSIDHYLPDLSGSDKAAMTARQLLCHQSGLPAHRRFYMRLQSVARAHRKSAVLDLLKRTPLEGRPGQRVQYSDLGFMLLCRLVEAAAGCPMNQFLAAEVYGPMGLRDLFFVDLTVDQRPSRAYAATELCPVRNRLLVGEVHDDNAWYAGGIDGHAGLFGTAMAVFQLLRHLAADLHGYSSAPLFSKQILAEVLCGVTPHPPLGFDRPSTSNSSAGRYFSTNTVGHLGFTGTSFWWDLDRDRCIVLLTNRIHPSRWNTRLQQFRPRIHDRIMEHFEI